MLNVFHGDAPDADGALEAADLVDWPAASRARLMAFRQQFEREGRSAAFAAFRQEQGEPLDPPRALRGAARALLQGRPREVALAQLAGRLQATPRRRKWPRSWREHADEVAFHAFMQFTADQGLSAAQRAAKDAGMGIGLIADLAVGTDSGGSHSWSRQDEMLIGLSIGAPPDLLNTRGQNWGISGFSPRGLRTHGFQAFLEMLRAALRHAGGVRIDHVLGLYRLWMVPDGASSAQGAYVALPAADLLRLTALESFRHRAIVLGEDLGTIPDGFQEQLIDAGVLGMRVLWFEQNEDMSYKPPSTWSREAVAMTTTHDLPTSAGWWRGTDIGWRHKIGLLADDNAVWFENENRARDRAGLWSVMQASGAAHGEAPPAAEPDRFVDAAIGHVARANCALVLLPLEDALGRDDQPNLPGTIDEHPNWRRRLPGPASKLLDAPAVAARLNILSKERPAS